MTNQVEPYQGTPISLTGNVLVLVDACVAETPKWHPALAACVLNRRANASGAQAASLRIKALKVGAGRPSFSIALAVSSEYLDPSGIGAGVGLVSVALSAIISLPFRFLSCARLCILLNSRNASNTGHGERRNSPSSPAARRAWIPGAGGWDRAQCNRRCANARPTGT